MAVRDGLIAKNPAQHAFGNFKRASGEKDTKRKALTVEEQRVFLEFIGEIVQVIEKEVF